MEYVVCDLCGKDDTKKLFEAKDLYNNIAGIFRVVQCKNCGFVYINPRPSGKELLKYYPDEANYFIPSLGKKRENRLKKLKNRLYNKILSCYWGYSHLSEISWWEKPFLFLLFLSIKRELLVKGVPRFCQKGKLLDIGCSYGAYLKRMEELGWETIGIEQNKKAAKFGSNKFKLKIINDSFENVNIDEKFDVITMRMVLEHLPSPSNAIKKVYSLLKKDGQLIIIVPDFSGIEFRLFKEYCYALQVPTHLNHFTPSTIKKFCEKYGFIIEKIIHHRVDRDFVASARYMRNEGVNRWLSIVLGNKLVRKTLLKAAVFLLSSLGMTSRMTVWARKAQI